MARLGRAQPNRPIVVRSTLEDIPETTPKPVVCSAPGIRRIRGRIVTARAPLSDAPPPPPPTPGLLTPSIAGSGLTAGIAGSRLTASVSGSTLTVTTSP